MFVMFRCTRDLREQIRQIYLNCPIGYEVDHEHPRLIRNERGEHVACGLHVPWNLQYLTRIENRRKHNKLALAA